jgi:Tol biopolymer transport system component
VKAKGRIVYSLVKAPFDPADPGWFGYVNWVNADGSSPTSLPGSGRDYDPAYSPDAQRIAFTSYRDGNNEIYSMKADGSVQRRLTRNGASDTGPDYSPDGRRIVFASDRRGNGEIYVMKTDGSCQRRLTRNPAPDAYPTFAPGGKRIAFSRGSELWVMNADGSGQRRLAGSMAEPLSATFSPNGRKLVFPDVLGLNVVNADGTGKRTLLSSSSSPYSLFTPAYSPSGRRLAYASLAGGLTAVNVARADGTSSVPIISAPVGLPPFAGYLFIDWGAG